MWQLLSMLSLLCILDSHLANLAEFVVLLVGRMSSIGDGLTMGSVLCK